MDRLSHKSSFKDFKRRLLMKKFLRPQWFFLLISILMLVIGYLNKENNLNLTLFGAIIKVSSFSICLLSAFFFFLIFINYSALYLINKKPKKPLTIIHIVLQLIAVIPFIYFLFTSKYFNDYSSISEMNLVLFLAFILFLIASVIHIINFVLSLFQSQD